MVRLLGFDISRRKPSGGIILSQDALAKLAVDQGGNIRIPQASTAARAHTLEMKDGKPVDERGFEYKQYNIYVVTERRITFPASSLLRLHSYVLPDPKTQRTTLLVTSGFPRGGQELRRGESQGDRSNLPWEESLGED